DGHRRARGGTVILGLHCATRVRLVTYHTWNADCRLCWPHRHGERLQPASSRGQAKQRPSRAAPAASALPEKPPRPCTPAAATKASNDFECRFTQRAEGAGEPLGPPTPADDGNFPFARA